MKKVLILQWNTVNSNVAITETIKELGFEYTLVDVNTNQRMDIHEGFFIDYLKDKKYDFAFSINYFDYLNEACHMYGIPYIAWTYDSPARIGNIDGLKYDTTNLFLFDSYETLRMRYRYGVSCVHYLPLAADIKRFDSIKIDKSDMEKYFADISFVGRLYDSEVGKYTQHLSDYHKGFINGVVDSTVGVYDSSIIETFHVEQLFKWESEEKFYDEVYKNEEDKRENYNYEEDFEWLHSIVARIATEAVSNRERLILISMLSNHWNFKLYSTSSHELFKSTTECGVVEYYKQMPKAFKCSKINLNNTYKGIKSGIPLRCLDVMGCKAFLLSNYQHDFEEHFSDGNNVVWYKSLDEAYDKCKFYLEHDSLREKIALKGYETVKKHYNYKSLIRQAIETSGLGHLLK